MLAEMRSPIAVVALALLLAATGAACANPFADDPTVEAGPSRELAATPEEIPDAVADELAESETGKGTKGRDGGGENGSGGNDEDGGPDADGSGSDGDGVQGADGGASTGPGSGATATATDGPGDHGIRAPAYADLRSVSLEDRGADLRITVEFDGPVPARLPEDETQGVGVDLYRGSADESAYQVFVDGGPEGWFAYWTTPSGFKRYPGTFGLGGAVMVFDVPWAAMKMPDAFRFSAFCDWTQRTTGIVNIFGEDHAPDEGPTGFSRA